MLILFSKPLWVTQAAALFAVSGWQGSGIGGGWQGPAEHLVQCSSHDKGKDVKAKCDAGCIACTLCTKQCEFDAIHMDNNVAVIDYEKCTNCGKCAAKCPAKVIL